MESRPRLRRSFPDLAQHIKVSIVEAGEILSLFDESLREFAVHKIESRPRMKILHKRVARVERDRVEFDDGTAGSRCGRRAWGRSPSSDSSTGRAPSSTAFSWTTTCGRSATHVRSDGEGIVTPWRPHLGALRSGPRLCAG